MSQKEVDSGRCGRSECVIRSTDATQVLDINAFRQAWLVPFDVGEYDALVEGMQGIDFTASDGHVIGVLAVAIKETFGVGNGIARLDHA